MHEQDFIIPDRNHITPESQAVSPLELLRSQTEVRRLVVPSALERVFEQRLGQYINREGDAQLNLRRSDPEKLNDLKKIVKRFRKAKIVALDMEGTPIREEVLLSGGQIAQLHDWVEEIDNEHVDITPYASFAANLAEQYPYAESVPAPKKMMKGVALILGRQRV